MKEKQRLIELMPPDFFRGSGCAELKGGNRQPIPRRSSKVRVEIEKPADYNSPTIAILIGANSRP